MAERPDYIDELILAARSRPPELCMDRQDYRDYNREYAARDPGYFTDMITNAEAAKMLGMSPGALRTLRSRGLGPKGWIDNIPGVGGRYINRVVILDWIAAHYDLPTKKKH